MTSGKPRARVASAGLALLLWAGAASGEQPPETVQATEAVGAAKGNTVAGYVPGKGFDVAKGDLGSLNISAYVLLRYLNQLPAEQTFTDHLGRERRIDTRQDIQLHRVMMHFSGYLFTPRFRQDTMAWAVNSTNSVTLLASLSYEFAREFVLGGGIGALPSTRSMNYEHPYFLGTDRQMADEFFRGSFTGGVWASGDLPGNLWYRVMLGDNLNIVDISASQLTRDMAFGLTMAWYPTTGEFGPRGGFGDLEHHEKPATRFGFSFAHSREDRFSQVDNPNPDNTTIKLSDSVPLFETGSLIAGSTMLKADYNMLSLDAAVKNRGLFLLGEVYFRRLSDFLVDGPTPPQSVINDTGFMVQASYMVVPERAEAYAVHSQLYGEFNRAWELTGGFNYYPFGSRALKLNASVTYVDRSPYGSLFGYFVGGQKGPTIALSTDYIF